MTQLPCCKHLFQVFKIKSLKLTYIKLTAMTAIRCNNHCKFFLEMLFIDKKDLLQQLHVVYILQ